MKRKIFRRNLLILVVLILMAYAAAGINYISTLDGSNQSIGDNNIVFIDNTNNMAGVGNKNSKATLGFSGKIKFGQEIKIFFWGVIYNLVEGIF